jgi:serine/threonine protein kinase
MSVVVDAVIQGRSCPGCLRCAFQKVARVTASVRGVSGDVAGERIGRYRLCEVIGRGGSSVVYRAINDHQVSLPQVVAVKVAMHERCADDGFRRAFLDQSRVSAVINHPNVLPVLDAGEDGGRPFLVMPHVSGVDLARQIAARALTVGRVLALLGQVASGLDALHRCGLLHLDVKPANVLVGKAGQPATGGVRGLPSAVLERAFLADLGMCRFWAEQSPARTDDFVGSPRYASPEHLRGGPVRAAADVYSLTCVLFTCLAGRPPYVGDLPAVVSGHLAGRIPSLAALTALPRQLDAVVRRGLHPDPRARFRTAGELIASASQALRSREHRLAGSTVGSV